MYVCVAYDVPYAGGYSVGYNTIYIDRHIPETFTAYCGRVYPLRELLIAHERKEIIYLRRGLSFNEAHKKAVDCDIRSMRKLGVPIDEYYGALHMEVVYALQRFKSGNSMLPPDLDMTPYRDDGLI